MALSSNIAPLNRPGEAAGHAIPPRRPVPLAVLALALASLGVLGLLPFLQLGDGNNIPRFALFLGRFHPVVLHVPIGMILLAILLEHAHVPGLRRWIPKVGPGTSTFLIFFAALTATASTLLGWMLSFSGGYDPELLHRHFYAGMATAIGANLALLLKLGSDARPGSRAARYAYQIVLLATGGCLALAGHLGASITHGEDYLTEYAPNPLRHLLGLPLQIDPADQPWKPLPERLAFDDVVEPILYDRCVSCHSGEKAKGGLRLDRMDLVIKGGNGGPAIVPGDAGKSLLMQYVDLPEDAEKHMPPKGKVQLTEGEQAILEWWIATGAPNGKIGELTVPPGVKLAMEQAVPEAVKKKEAEAQKQEAAKLAAALGPLQKSLPGSLRLVAAGDPRLEYMAGADYARVGDDVLRKLEGVGGNIVILDLARTRVTDTGLRSLAKMPNLVRLEIQETNTGAAGLDWIKGLTKLEVINFYDTAATDQDLAELAPLKKLRRLYVSGTKVTEAGIVRLRKQLPELEIVQAVAIPKIPPSPAVLAAIQAAMPAAVPAATPKPSPASMRQPSASPAPVKK